MVTATSMTLSEFLELPETEPPSEFVCGRIIPKPMPTFNHAALTPRLIGLFTIYLLRSAEAIVFDNLRHADTDESRAYLPDISLIRRERLPRDPEQRRRGPVDIVPDLAIEVSSPDDRPARIADKLAFYLRLGVPLTWIIDPDERTLTAYRPFETQVTYGIGDTIQATPVLSEFQLNLSDLFSVLDDGMFASS